jgi:hypothetical protein
VASDGRRRLGLYGCAAVATIAATLIAFLTFLGFTLGGNGASNDSAVVAPTTPTAATPSPTPTTSTPTPAPAASNDSPSPTSAPPVAPARTFLKELGRPSSPAQLAVYGQAAIGGTSYATSAFVLHDGCHPRHELVYELGGRYETFKATVGLGSGSATDTVVEFKVYVDNVPVTDVIRLGVGPGQPIEATIGGGSILTLESVEVEGRFGHCSGDGWAVWGDGAVYG